MIVIEANIIKLLYPEIRIVKNQNPMIFIDTFFWKHLCNKCSVAADMLKSACVKRKICIVITNMLKGELYKQGVFEEIVKNYKLCLKNVAIYDFTINQILHSLIAFSENHKKVNISWRILNLGPVPFDAPSLEELKDIAKDIASKLNKVREHVFAKLKNNKDREEHLIMQIINVERHLWLDKLIPYKKIAFTRRFKEKYEEFFYTDYFTDLPSVVLRAYTLAYILKQREIKVQDVVDIYNISEIVPFVDLAVIDKDQHERLKQLKSKYTTKDFAFFEKLLEDRLILSSIKGWDKLIEGFEHFLNKV